jgi:uncharacterized membrane protein YcaP (DUF421 family)
MILIAAAARIPPVTLQRVEVQSIKTLIVVVALIIGFRLFGKREATQLNVYDLAMLMALANAVQNAMTAGLGNLPIGLTASTTVVVGAWAVSRLLVRQPALEARVVGTPTVLVHKGKLIPQALRRQNVTRAELEEALRQHGLQTPSDAALAVLEVDGSISIVPKPTTRPDGQ